MIEGGYVPAIATICDVPLARNLIGIPERAASLMRKVESASAKYRWALEYDANPYFHALVLRNVRYQMTKLHHPLNSMSAFLLGK